MNLKKLFSDNLRVCLKAALRKSKDMISGVNYLLATKIDRNLRFDFPISLTQPIKKTGYFENKIHNISTGCNSIDGIIIYPNEVFSFWKLINNPSKKRGYLLSRNLISGKLKEDYGGGLCQLSSIIYHLSLIAGMDIWERHNHSVDIYKERDRFTPLGSDATVVYGYKDLRIRNNLGIPVKISLSIIDNNLKCVFSSNQPLKRHKIVFHRIDNGDSVEVETFDCSDHEKKRIGKSVYKRLSNMHASKAEVRENVFS